MLTQDITTQLFYHTLSFLIIITIVRRGIKGGIEKLNYFLMPVLIIIITGMFIYSLGLESFSKAWDFMFGINYLPIWGMNLLPDFTMITPATFVTAVGHAFFTLSLGMASILTYSASLPKNINLKRTALMVIGLDTSIALIAGLMLFTFLFQYGAEPSTGPGLVFISLPVVFYEMGSIGVFLSLVFFIALAFAGLTSAVSLLEPMVQYLIDRLKFSRTKATLSMGLFFYVIGTFALISNSTQYGEYLTFAGKNLFDWLDFITASILLPLGGLIVSIFVGYYIPRAQLRKALQTSMSDRFFAVWYHNIRDVVPLALILVMINLLVEIPPGYIYWMFFIPYVIWGVWSYGIKPKKN